MYEDCIAKITGGRHDIDLDELSKLPSQLNDPILLFEGSQPNSFVALTELIDKQGNDIVVAVHINKKFGRSIVNKIASVYSKTNDFGNNKIIQYVNNQIKQGKLLDASAKKHQYGLRAEGSNCPSWFKPLLMLTKEYHKMIQVSMLILCKILRKMHRKRLTAEKMLRIPFIRRNLKIGSAIGRMIQRTQARLLMP